MSGWEALSACCRAKWKPALWVLLLVAPGCGASVEERAELDAIECAALSTAVDSLAFNPLVSRFVLAESTGVVTVADSDISRTWPLDQYLAPSGPLAWVYDSLKLSSSTIRSFRERNRRATTPCTDLATRLHTTVLPLSTIREMEIATAPEDVGFFLDSTVYIGASRVGISDNRREALLTLVPTCGALCATFWVVVLSRDDDQPWQVKYTILAGVS